MRPFALAAAIAGGLCLTAAADAATLVPIQYEDGTGGFFQSVKNAFSYDYTFVIDDAGYITASLTSSAVTSPISFTSVTLNGIALTKSLTDNSYYLADPIEAAAGTQILHVEGTGSARPATFSGTVQFLSAIPEPASWAMMTGGFALAGVTMRQRRRTRLI